MDKAELLSTFTEQVDQYARFRSFIDKARGQQGKFSEAVIEKVCLDNELKSLEVSEVIRPLIGDIEKILDDLGDRRDRINETKANADADMEELQLRQIIGEMTEEEYEAESGEILAAASTANERLEALENDLTEFQGILDRWVELATDAGHDAGLAGAEPEPIPSGGLEPEPELEEPAPPESDELFVAPGDSEDSDEEPILFSEPEDFLDADDVMAGEPDESSPGEHAARVGMVEDMSAIFGDEGGDDALAIEVGELSDDEGSVDIDIGVDEAVADDLDILSEAGAEEVEIDLLGAEDAEDIGVELEAENGDPNKGPRRALLLYQEGTPEEQIYPFTSDVITIGRGRENDIQIKNDSKVSRYHCKIFRRGDNFYIEDNKSSNGSLVNGELITERRLFGGEEIVIGETFFRFRIME